MKILVAGLTSGSIQYHLSGGNTVGVELPLQKCKYPVGGYDQ